MESYWFQLPVFSSRSHSASVEQFSLFLCEEQRFFPFVCFRLLVQARKINLSGFIEVLRVCTFSASNKSKCIRTEYMETKLSFSIAHYLTEKPYLNPVLSTKSSPYLALRNLSFKSLRSSSDMDTWRFWEMEKFKVIYLFNM